MRRDPSRRPVSQVAVERMAQTPTTTRPARRGSWPVIFDPGCSCDPARRGHLEACGHALLSRFVISGTP